MRKKVTVLTVFFMMIITIGYAEPVKISVHPMPNFVDKIDNNKVDGIVIRRLQEAFCRMGENVEFNLRPWKRAYHELTKGAADALAGVLRNSEREKLFDFSKNHILTPRNILAVRQGYTKLAAAPEDLSRLTKYTMDYVRGYSLMERLDAVKGKYIPAEGQSVDPNQAVRKLLKGRFEILIMDEYVLRGVLSDLGAKDKVVILKPPIQEKPSYIAFPKTRKLQNLIDRIDKALESMMEDGTYEKIADDYLADKRSKFQCSK